ncbi:hypothetical protein F5Y14DRAFT_452610 [Nemania sp. NC0429]|nr:hypothetical protein F5Y14DRAFT_452610 [Nemania sp. NC0429]
MSNRAYPLSRKDMDVFNEYYDGLHSQGRMDWVNEPTPFTHPVFIAWRTVPDKSGELGKTMQKGRVVVDLRELNKGKHYITVVDATAFFHQFLVHPDYRDRFAVISPRGIERYRVAALEQYIGASSWLRNLILYYAKISEPLQKRKAALLAEGRKEGRIETGKPNKRKAYVQSTYYEPTRAEKALFAAV